MSAQPDFKHWQQFQTSLPAVDYSLGANSSTYMRQQDYQSHFDETMSDEPSLSDQESSHDSIATAETPAIDLERGNALLNFSKQTPLCHLLDFNYRPVNISFSSQLSGKFCFSPASSAFGASPVSPIICYRRNLFTASGSITLPRNLRFVSLRPGEHAPISSTELHISATETLENNTVKLISVPIKAVQAQEGKSEPEPTTIPLTPFESVGYEQDYFSLPVEWKRLQFRNSTANNGRRKELQQHFVITIRVIATLESGQRISIYEASSTPLVVRGRSPRNFLPKSKTGSIGSRRSQSRAIESPLLLTKIKSEPSGSFQNMALPSPSYSVWHSAPDTSSYQSEGVVAHALPGFDPYNSQRTTPFQGGLFQQDNEDYFGQNPLNRSHSVAHHSPRTSPFYVGAFGSGSYTHESSYEYFPPVLGNSWTEQFNTLYQPHVLASDLTLPPEPRTKSLKGKPKQSHRRPSNGKR